MKNVKWNILIAMTHQENEFWRSTLRYIILKHSEQQGWRRDPISFQRKNKDSYRKWSIRLASDFASESRRLKDNKKCLLVAMGESICHLEVMSSQPCNQQNKDILRHEWVEGGIKTLVETHESNNGENVPFINPFLGNYLKTVLK